MCNDDFRVLKAKLNFIYIAGCILASVSCVLAKMHKVSGAPFTIRQPS